MVYKRESVVSEASDFSFEQNEEDILKIMELSESRSTSAAIPNEQPISTTLQQTASTTTITETVLTYEQLLQENIELKQLNCFLKDSIKEQELLIVELKSQISKLDNQTITTSARPSISVPVTPNSSSHSDESSIVSQKLVSEKCMQERLDVDCNVPREKNEGEAEMITVPVRSLQRHKASPLKVSDNSAVQVILMNNEEGNNDSTLTDSITQPEALAINTNQDMLAGQLSTDDESSDEEINKSHLSTPVRSIVDDSTLLEIQETNLSPEVNYLKSPPVITTPTQQISQSVTGTSSRQQSPSILSYTPHRNVVVTHIPSPSPSRILTSSNDISIQTLGVTKQSESVSSSTTTVNQNDFTNTEQLKNRASRLNLSESNNNVGTSSPLQSRISTPISPIRSVALANAQQEHQRTTNLSIPTTPTNSSNYLTINNGISESISQAYSDYSVPLAGLTSDVQSQSYPSLSHSISRSSLASSNYSSGSVRPYTMSTSSNNSPVVREQPQFSPSHQFKKQSPALSQFPTDVPLFVQPEQLSSVKPVIISTISTANLKKSDEPFITISVHDRSSDKEIWRFKKTHGQFIKLDQQIRPLLLDLFSVPPMPDKTLFQSTIPVKVDQRRSQLTDYILSLFHIPHIPLEVAYKLARFMSLDIVNLLDEVNIDVAKEGWLLRKGKSIKGGSWKVRYAQIDGPFMKVYETNPNLILNSGKPSSGVIIETIRLSGAQIGRQPSTSESEKNGYIHAFAIMELKKGSSGNFNKFVFCSETDYERDEWVQTLLQFADPHGISSQSGDSESVHSSIRGDTNYISSQMVSESPIRGEFGAIRYQDVESQADDLEDLLVAKEKEKEIKKQRKKSFFPFAKKTSLSAMGTTAVLINDLESTASLASNPDSSYSNIERSLQSMNLNTNQPSHSYRIFQNDDLDQVIALSPNHFVSNHAVPSIISRCIDYLTVNNAINQEGIFRLSGSAALIKQFREQFDAKYDIDFDQLLTKPDINTVAGLLKLWFRELPSSIIPREIQMEMKMITEKYGSDNESIAREYSILISHLTSVVQSILSVLFEYLHKIVMRCDINKMNLRNLCIVFSPTLNLQAECLVPLIVEHAAIFQGKDILSLNQRRAIEGANASSF